MSQNFTGIKLTNAGTSSFTPSRVDDAPITINLLSGQTGDAFDIVNSAGTNIGKIDKDGNLTVAGTVTGSGTVNSDGNITVATGKTLAVTDADALTVGGIIVPQKVYLSPKFDLATNCVSTAVFVAPEALKITKIDEVHGTAESTAGSLAIQVEKLTGTTAAGSGTALLTNNTNAGFDGKATANTVQNGTLTATAASLTLAAGDRIGVKFSASATELKQVVVAISLKRV